MPSSSIVAWPFARTVLHDRWPCTHRGDRALPRRVPHTRHGSAAMSCRAGGASV